jgi:hypothetical protein
LATHTGPREESLRLRLVKVIVLSLFVSVLVAAQGPVRPINQLEKFKARAPITEKDAAAPADSVFHDQWEWFGNRGGKVLVDVVRYQQDAKAFEKLSLAAAAAKAQITRAYGTAGFQRENEIVFVKGSHLVTVRNVKADAASFANLGRELTEAYDKGEGDTPVLLKHFPIPEEAEKNAVFLHNFVDLNQFQLQQGVLTAVDSRGNADAALASYGPSKMLIVEFNTPQLAQENDERIIARIQELWKLGQPAPTAYRRIGNYSVFVFDAPDEQSAKTLIDQVKYEQVVQWLGENPYIIKQAEQHYVNTTLGVLVAVVKASGYALLACLGIGALAGALLFVRRRAQQSAEAFSDAGGMLRLNLDDLTPETNPARLLQDRN